MAQGSSLSARYPPKWLLFGVPSAFLLDVLATSIFGYLLFDGLMVLWFAGPFSRIDLLGFLVPHSSKVVLWSFASLVVLRPRFGWRFPFVMLSLYCASELLTNWVWMAVHIPFGYIFPPGTEVLFALSNAFFILSLVLCYIFIKGRFSIKPDWSILPFLIFLASWVMLGYNTEATIIRASYWLETQELLWNALYVLMAVNIFVPKKEIP